MDLLQLLGSFSLLVAAVSYCTGADNRRHLQEDARKARQYQAWQVISNAQGKPGNGGRTQALRELNDDEIDLSGIDVAKAYLVGVVLPFAKLEDIQADSANLSDATLLMSDVSGGSFRSTRLEGVDLRGIVAGAANFSSSMLSEICAERGAFGGASFRSADVVLTSFAHANLAAADFRNAKLRRVNFDSANLQHADFRGAFLDNSTFEGAFLKDANFFGSSVPERASLRARGAVWVQNDSVWEQRFNSFSQLNVVTALPGFVPDVPRSQLAGALGPRSHYCERDSLPRMR